MDKQLVIGIVCSSIAFAMLVGGIVLALFVGNRKRLQQKMRFTQIELSYEQELRKVEGEVSEQMMERFAQELHDNVGHILTCMRMRIENGKLDEPALEEIFLPIEGYLNDASQQLRLLSRSLNSEYISDAGLGHAIELEIDRLRQLRRLHIVYRVEGAAPVLDKDQSLMAFRIFQEVVHNAFRHSKASSLNIVLTDFGGFGLHIQDDGQGFGVEETLGSHKASGLRNIRRRAQLAGMNCHVESAPNAGCSYIITLVNQISDSTAANS